MSKIGFVGFGEVNTPVEVVIRKGAAAAEALKSEGLDLVEVYPKLRFSDEDEVCSLPRSCLSP